MNGEFNLFFQKACLTLILIDLLFQSFKQNWNYTEIAMSSHFPIYDALRKKNEIINDHAVNNLILDFSLYIKKLKSDTLTDLKNWWKDQDLEDNDGIQASMKSFLDLDNKLDEVKIRIDNINWVLHKWLIQMNVNMWVNEIMGNMYTFKDPQNQIDWIPDKIYEREINFSYIFSQQLKSFEKYEHFNQVIITYFHQFFFFILLSFKYYSK